MGNTDRHRATMQWDVAAVSTGEARTPLDGRAEPVDGWLRDRYVCTVSYLHVCTDAAPRRRETGNGKRRMGGGGGGGGGGEGRRVSQQIVGSSRKECGRAACHHEKKKRRGWERK